MKKILILLSNVQYAIISDSDSWLVTNTCFLGQEKCRRPPPPSLVHAREVEFTHKSGKIVVFCKKCDLDFDLDFPDKNVILIWNQYLGCDFDFDFKITFHCVILILIWNQLQSDLSHHWRTDERTTITTIWKKTTFNCVPVTSMENSSHELYEIGRCFKLCRLSVSLRFQFKLG